MLFFGSAFGVIAQTEFTFEKAATVSHNLTNRWSAEIGTEYRNTPTSAIGEEVFKFNSQHIQFAANAAYEIGFYAKLGGGIMYRFNTLESSSNENETRLTQQYTYARPFNALRLGHRIKLDQRIRPSRTTHRIRYRFAADFALSGVSLNLREFYGVASTESLLNTGTAEKPAWDQRFNLGIGNQLFEKVKIQVDLQYRIENFFNTSAKRLFVVTQVFYKI